MHSSRNLFPNGGFYKPINYYDFLWLRFLVKPSRIYIYIVVALSQCAREVLCDIVDLHYDVSTRSISPDVSDLNLSPGAAPMVLKLSWSCPNSAMPSNRGIPRAR